MEQVTETEQKKKVSANDAIISMLMHINTDRRDLVYKSVEAYLETLSKNGDYFFRIKRLLAEKPLPFLKLDNLPASIKSLIRQVPNETIQDNVFLNEPIQVLINTLLLEWKNKETFKNHNLPVRNKILLHGVTGNGKTTIARHIAKLTELPFVEINSDVVVDSKIGKSGFNIHQIFNNIKEPCVLFWDEVDSIGRKRDIGGDNAAGLENERMVNSILVNIEKLTNDVIFIGATNRYSVLDSAFLRRFDVKFEIAAPTYQEKTLFIEGLTKYYNLPTNYIPETAVALQNFSEIKFCIVDVVRKYVLEILK